MAGEVSSSSASTSQSNKLRKNKMLRQDSSPGVEPPDSQVIKQTTRGGLRVYKIVVLGDGGVGKSGKFQNLYDVS